LKDGGIKIRNAKDEAVGREFFPKQTDPFASVKVCITAFVLS
jgi:hypothetical protein